VLQDLHLKAQLKSGAAKAEATKETRKFWRRDHTSMPVSPRLQEPAGEDMGRFFFHLASFWFCFYEYTWAQKVKNDWRGKKRIGKSYCKVLSIGLVFGMSREIRVDEVNKERLLR
jgi:hypothetical protein